MVVNVPLRWRPSDRNSTIEQCKACGTTLQPTAKFCHECGQKILSRTADFNKHHVKVAASSQAPPPHTLEHRITEAHERRVRAQPAAANASASETSPLRVPSNPTPLAVFNPLQAPPSPSKTIAEVRAQAAEEARVAARKSALTRSEANAKKANNALKAAAEKAEAAQKEMEDARVEMVSRRAAAERAKSESREQRARWEEAMIYAHERAKVERAEEAANAAAQIAEQAQKEADEREAGYMGIAAGLLTVAVALATFALVTALKEQNQGGRFRLPHLPLAAAALTFGGVVGMLTHWCRRGYLDEHRRLGGRWYHKQAFTWPSERVLLDNLEEEEEEPESEEEEAPEKGRELDERSETTDVETDRETHEQRAAAATRASLSASPSPNASTAVVHERAVVSPAMSMTSHWSSRASVHADAGSVRAVKV